MKIKDKKIVIKILQIVFVIYLGVLAYFLFFSEHYGRHIVHTEYRYNLTLFLELKRFIKYRELLGIESFVVNIIGNIFAFTPFGFILPIISSDKRKLIRVTTLTFIFSLTIELLQLFLKVGIFDVDDLLMNTLGGVIGYLIFVGFNLFRKRKSR